MTSTENVNVSFFKKGKSRPSTGRRRSPTLSQPTVAAEPPSKSQVVLPSRKATTNLLSAGTKRTTSQRDEFGDQPEKDGPDVKWTADGSHVKTALDIIAGDEAEELLAKRLKKEKDDAGESEEEAPDGLYRGQQAYRSHVKKSKDVPKAMRVGPQRSANTIRTVTIVDYQPDVCKDYKGESSQITTCDSLYLSFSSQKPGIADLVIRVNFCTIGELVGSDFSLRLLLQNSSQLLRSGWMATRQTSGESQEEGRRRF